jgi:hypothetical protein
MEGILFLFQVEKRYKHKIMILNNFFTKGDFYGNLDLE